MTLDHAEGVVPSAQGGAPRAEAPQRGPRLPEARGVVTSAS